MSLETIKKPIWDIDQPDYLACRKYIVHTDTYGTQIFAEENNHGVTHILYSAARFQILKGIAPAPLADPGDYPANIAGGALEGMRESKKAFATQKKCVTLLTNTWEAGLPPRIRALLEVNHSLDHLTVQEQVEQLLVALPLRQVDLVFLAAQISKPYVSGTHIETHVRQQLENLAHLASAGQPMGPLDAVSKMFSSFQSTATDKEDFARVRSEFLLFHGPHAQQTPQNFAVFIVDFVNNRLAEHRVLNTAARGGLALLATSSNPPSHPSDADLADYHAYLAYKALPKGKTVGASKTPPAVAAVSKPARSIRIPAPGAPPFYCWSCGTKFNPTFEHYSNEYCKFKKPGHQKQATLANQMGGTKP